jgi:hypothetical protein
MLHAMVRTLNFEAEDKLKSAWQFELKKLIDYEYTYLVTFSAPTISQSAHSPSTWITCPVREKFNSKKYEKKIVTNGFFHY